MSKQPFGATDLLQAGSAFVQLMEQLSAAGVELDTVQGLEAWALSWGPRLMDEVDRLSRQAGAVPQEGSRDLFRLWLDRRGHIEAAIDAPTAGEPQSHGEFRDEPHFVAVYELLAKGQELIGNMLKAMKGNTQ